MKKTVSTPEAPAAIGPYAQAIRVGDLLFVSGQIPVDPATGNIPEGITAQAQQSLSNLQAIVKAAGLTLADVVKTTVFLSDMNEFQAMNAVYASFFATEPPARSTVEVARLPKDVRVEIECIASAVSR